VVETKQPLRLAEKRIKALSAVFCAFCFVVQGVAAQEPEKEVERFLLELCRSLLADQEQDRSSEHFGAIRCPSTNPLPHGYHVRAAEAVFPFAVLARRAQSKEERRRFREAAFALGDWLVAQQQSDGSWLETPHQWWGTTANQLLCLAGADIVLGKMLDSDRRSNWESALRRAGDFLILRFHPGDCPTSQASTAACALSLAGRLVQSEAWKRHAESLTRAVLENRTPEGFFREDRFGSVDAGIALCQTLPMLALQALLQGNRPLLEEASSEARRLLAFVAPDGSLATGWGDRIERYLVWGVFGGYGPTACFGLLGRTQAVFKRAAVLTLRFAKRCTMPDKRAAGALLLGYGPDKPSRARAEDLCVYPTVTEAVGLALALTWGELNGPQSELPTPPRVRVFRRTRIALICTDSFRALLSWRRSPLPGVYPPGGGALAHLYLHGLGSLHIASPSVFVRREVLHLPRQRDVQPLTPRVQSFEGNAWYSNLFEDEPEFSWDPNRPTEFSFEGNLRDVAGRTSGITYKLKYRFDAHHLVKTLRISRGTKPHSVVVVEPLIVSPSWPVSRSVYEVRFNTERGLLRIFVDTPRTGILLNYSGENQFQFFPILPAVRTRPLELRFTDPYVSKARWILQWAPAGSDGAESGS